jgi:hypothetical protein
MKIENLDILLDKWRYTIHENIVENDIYIIVN